MSQAKVAAPYVPLTASNLTPEQLAELKRNFQKTLVQVRSFTLLKHKSHTIKQR